MENEKKSANDNIKKPGDDIWQTQSILVWNPLNGQDCISLQMAEISSPISLSMVILRTEHNVPDLHRLKQWVIPIHLPHIHHNHSFLSCI